LYFRNALAILESLAGHKKPKPKTEAEITETETEIHAKSVFGHHIGPGNQVTEIFWYRSVVERERPKRPKTDSFRPNQPIYTFATSTRAHLLTLLSFRYSFSTPLDRRQQDARTCASAAPPPPSASNCERRRHPPAVRPTSQQSSIISFLAPSPTQRLAGTTPPDLRILFLWLGLQHVQKTLDLRIVIYGLWLDLRMSVLLTLLAVV
jgi:hypothetical protein